MTRLLLGAFALVTFSSFAAAQDYHPARDLALDDIPWTSDNAEFLDRKRFKTSLTPEERKVDRPAMLDAAIAEARKSGKPVLWYVYKIVESSKRGRQMIRAPVLDIAMRQEIWSDPDVARIVKASFTPLRMVCDEPLCKRFDVRPLSFLEPAVMFIDGDGKVIHSVRTIRTFEASWFRGVLRDVLRKAKGPFVDDQNADAAMDRGEYERVLAAIRPKASGPDPIRQYERATMLRRLRRGEDALKALAAAEESFAKRVAQMKKGLAGRAARSIDRALRSGRLRGRPPEGVTAEEISNLARLRADVAAERGRILIRLGRFEDAVGPLMLAADSAVGTRSAEAAWWLARLRVRAGDEAAGIRLFQKIVQDHPDSLWARRANANVLVGIDDGRPLGAVFSGVARLTWMPEAAYSKTLPIDTRWPAEPLPVADVVANNVRFLLEQQRSDGGWNDSRYSYCPDARITPNVWVAVSALASQALLRHRDRAPESLRAEIDDALHRADRYLLDPLHMNRGKNEDVYSDAYRLLYLAEKHRHLDNETARRGTRLAMRSIIIDAENRQKDAGFWAHEYDNAFCTAAMVQGLVAAKSVGVKVPDAVLDSAKRALLSARAEDGSFSYGGKARGKGGETALRNASTRMPLSEGALLSLGASDTKKTRFAFDTFWKYYDRIEGVRRTDFHSDGQIAGFMFFHALFHTSEAIRTHRLDGASEELKRLLNKVLTYPEMDGTFMDSHEVGRSYGTAMALLVIANALDDIE